MWTLILGVIVNLLVFFFERWWTNNHPVSPTAAKTAFLAEVARPKHFWMGSKRHKMAEKLFDKFAARYDQSPPVFQTSDAPLSPVQAKILVQAYASGLTITPDEIK